MAINCTYRIFKGKLETEQYVSAVNSRNHRSILAKLRRGSLPLLIETGRYAKVSLPNRICQLCNSNQIEDGMLFFYWTVKFIEIYDALY